MFELTEVDPSWHQLFTPHIVGINSVLKAIENRESTPARQSIFKAFTLALPEVKVLILGQDPYPTEGVADGLAFSSGTAGVIPASLRNIFTEYCADLGFSEPTSGNLRPWLDSGVLLLNTALTTEIGERDKHKGVGWQPLISTILTELANRDVVAILWGNSAKSQGERFSRKIESVHPSPLSAHRGFFGSKPFSKANTKLIELGGEPIDWKLP